MTGDTITGGSERVSYRRTVALVVGSALVLTMAFIGGLAFLEQSTEGIQGRFPWFFVAGGALFVASILLLETQTDDGSQILFTAVVVTVVGSVTMVLAIEGLIFAVRNPGEMLISQLVLYFIAAGLLATGFGYWTLHHWREFVAE